MKKNFPNLALATLIVVNALCAAVPVTARMTAGSTALDIGESAQLAAGWSVKKTLLGKNIYNEAGQKVAKVQDLIISPERNVTYIVVGVGGFFGFGRHDVPIASAQIQNYAGRLVMPGATAEKIKNMPAFVYAPDMALRNQLVAAAEKDIALGRAKVADLQKKASLATADAKAKLDLEIAALQSDLQLAQDKLSQMKQASKLHWRQFEVDVNAATARLRKAIEKAMG